MREDSELLRRYVEFHSEADFTELVRRHLGFVYHAALRRTGGRADLAEDISQQVFTTLARKAAVLCDHPVLAGWLHTTTRNAATTVLRTERRRAAREHEAQRMSELDNSEISAEWPAVRRELDRVLDQLPERDREAILLRFFHHKPFAQIGAALSLNEDAARKRVDRALGRLHQLLTQRGVTSTAAALATMLAGQSALAAPTGLVQSVATTALVNASASGVSAGIISFMSTKTTLSVVGLLGLAGLLILPTAGIALSENREAQKSAAELATARNENEVAREGLARIRKSAEEADQAAAQSQALLQQARAAAAASATKSTVPATTVSGVAIAPSPAASTTRTDAQKFFAQYSQARALIMELGNAQIHRNYAGFYRFAGATPQQITQFEAELANHWITSADLTPNSLKPGSNQLPDERFAAIFGDEGLRRYREYQHVRQAYEFTAQVAAIVGYGASPLSDAQADRMVQAVISNDSAYQAGRNVDLDTVDWTAMTGAIKENLSPAQWRAAESLVLSIAYRRALSQAHQQAIAAGNSAKP